MKMIKPYHVSILILSAVSFIATLMYHAFCTSFDIPVPFIIAQIGFFGVMVSVIGLAISAVFIKED